MMPNGMTCDVCVSINIDGGSLNVPYVWIGTPWISGATCDIFHPTVFTGLPPIPSSKWTRKPPRNSLLGGILSLDQNVGCGDLFFWWFLLYLFTWATKKKTYYFPLYWLVNQDPYNGLLSSLSLYNWVVFHPLYNPTNQGFFIAHLFRSKIPYVHSMKQKLIDCFAEEDVFFWETTLTYLWSLKQIIFLSFHGWFSCRFQPKKPSKGVTTTRCIKKHSPIFPLRKNSPRWRSTPRRWSDRNFQNFPRIQSEGPVDAGDHFFFVLSRFLRKSLAIKERCEWLCMFRMLKPCCKHRDDLSVSWFPCYISFCILRKIS